MSEEKEVLKTYLLPFLNLKKRFPLLKALENTSVEAQVMGLSSEELLMARQELQHLAEKAASEILGGEQSQEWMEKYPIDKTDVVLGVGSDNMEHLAGWFEILKYLSHKSLSGTPRFLNYGFEGETTVELLRRLPSLLEQHKPNWLFVDIGLSDCLSMPVESGKTLVSLADTYENISAIESLAEEFVEHPVVWISPTSIITKMAEEAPFLKGKYDISSIHSIREIIAGKTGFIVDPKGERIGQGEPEVWYLTENGVHHSLAGHIETVKHVLKTLAETKAKKGKQLGTKR